MLVQLRVVVGSLISMTSTGPWQLTRFLVLDMTSLLLSSFQSNQIVIDYQQDMRATIIPLRIPCHARHCCGSQVSQPGETIGYFDPLKACIVLASIVLIFHQRIFSLQQTETVTEQNAENNRLCSTKFQLAHL